VYGDGGRIIQDITSTPLRAFIERPAGYIGEKVDAETGWVFPVPDETHVHGHDAMMQHVVEAFRRGETPRETFRDGFIVNAILDAAYRSMKTGRWESVELGAGLAAA
jgi:predicted dehydrogenase